MNVFRRTPFTPGLLFTFFILLLTLVGCEKGTLGLRGGSISGQVVDSRTLIGIQGVNVTGISGDGVEAATKYTQTDSQGRYNMSDLRLGEWSLNFDRAGYQPVAEDSTGTVKVVVVNKEHRVLPQVRMAQSFANQYITIRGVLKDSKTGASIQLGNAQFIFGQEVFNNRLPTELQSGFSVPAQVGQMDISIQVTGYKPYQTEITGATDRDLGIIQLEPQTYRIEGTWRDVPGWVFQEGPEVKIFAYAGNRVVATATSSLSNQSFELTGIPMGVSVTIDAEVKGFRMNGPIPVVPNSEFQGVIYQVLSLKNNFSQILRDVRIIVNGSSIGTNERVGAYCNESGTTWPTTIVTGGVLGIGNPRVIDLGVNQVPTGYTLTFTGFNIEDGTVGTTRVMINDDGTDPQVVVIQVN